LHGALIHPSLTSGLLKLKSLDASEKYKNDYDDKNDAETAGRPVAPVSAVIPSRQCAKERQDQKDD
jgi:hypothetical protein